MKYSSLLLIVLFNISISLAQIDKIGPKIHEGPFIENLHSDIVNQDYKLLITLPADYSPEELSYPVLYYLDAWVLADMLNVISYYHMLMKEIDPIILVGISYDTDLSGWEVLRARDYCPTLNETDSIHAADNFVKFIKTELIPHIEKKYAANPDDRGLIGFSLGGLFTTWMLKREPFLFQKLAITSPSLWWGDSFLFNDTELLANIKNAQNLEVFTAVGSLENQTMVKNTNKIFDLLNANKNIQSTKVIFEDENHNTVWPAIFTRALNFLYQNLYPVLIKEGDELYEEENYKVAIAKFLEAFELHPEQITQNQRYNLACTYSLHSEYEASFTQLKILADEGYDNYDWILKDKDLDALHSDKRWIDLLTIFKNNKEQVVKN